MGSLGILKYNSSHLNSFLHFNKRRKYLSTTIASVIAGYRHIIGTQTTSTQPPRTPSKKHPDKQISSPQEQT